MRMKLISYSHTIFQCSRLYLKIANRNKLFFQKLLRRSKNLTQDGINDPVYIGKPRPLKLQILKP